MAVKNPQFEINVRKNTNANNPGYGKYYPKAKEKQTISLRGLTNHMAGHNWIYGRDVIEGVLTKMSYLCIRQRDSQDLTSAPVPTESEFHYDKPVVSLRETGSFITTNSESTWVYFFTFLPFNF